jgi:6-phosphogluconate dehydrogenase
MCCSWRDGCVLRSQLAYVLTEAVETTIEVNVVKVNS